MSPPSLELAGIVALAVVVIRECFAMVRWGQRKANGTDPARLTSECRMLMESLHDRLAGLDAEIVRIRERNHVLANEIASVKGEWEMFKRHRPLE